MMYGEDDGGDLMALVRSCSSLAKGKGIAETPLPAPDPLLYLPPPPPPPPPPFPMGMEESLLTPPPPPPPFPMGMEESLLTPPPPPPPFPMGMEESLPTIFPDLFVTNQMEFGDWEDICMPFQHPPQLQPPQSDDLMPLHHPPQLEPPESHPFLLHHPTQLQPPQSHPQLQPQLLQPPQSHPQLQEGFFQSLLVAASAVQPPLQQTKRPQPTTALNSKRKNDKNKVVNLSADIRVADDHWSWRKYGRKSIKGSSFPRSYYRCSINKCPARKTVEKSPWEPEMFAISYMGEHSHPAPIYRNYPTGSPCNKYCVSSSGENKPDSAAGTSSGQSPMTPLAISPSMEEDGEESWLDILDMDILGDDDLPFLGDNDGISFEDNAGGAAGGGGDRGGAN